MAQKIWPHGNGYWHGNRFLRGVYEMGKGVGKGCVGVGIGNDVDFGVGTGIDCALSVINCWKQISNASHMPVPDSKNMLTRCTISSDKRPVTMKPICQAGSFVEHSDGRLERTQLCIYPEVPELKHCHNLRNCRRVLKSSLNR